MNFAKFTALIKTHSLYFSSLSQFIQDDPFEGLPSRLNFQASGDEVIDRLQKESFLGSRDTFYVSCWHMNEGESDSQWKIYGANPQSLAIVSDFKRLTDAISDSRTIYGSEIIYYSPEKDMTSSYGIHQPVMKRKAFEHEKEFRLFNWDHRLIGRGPVPKGIEVSIQIKTLIEKIVVSPRAPKGFIDAVARLTKEYGFTLEITHSDLLEPLSY